MELKDAMHALLSKARGLQLYYQTAHWTCQGPEYYADHLMYARLYENLNEEVDAIGERAVGLTLDIDTVAMADSLHAILESIASETVAPEDLTVVAIGLEEEFLGLLDVFNKSPISTGLLDLVGSLASKHEEHLYLLQNRAGLTGGQPEIVQEPTIIVMSQKDQVELFRWNQYVISVDMPLMGDGTITGTIAAPTGWIGTWNCYPDGDLAYSDELNVPHQIQEMLKAACDEFLIAADHKVKKAFDDMCIEVKMRIKDGKVPISDLLKFWTIIKQTKKMATANVVDHRILTFIDKFNKALMTMPFKDQDIIKHDLKDQGHDPEAIEKIFVKFYEAIKPYEKLVF